MTIVGLDHVQVAAPSGCEPEARAFYGALLGLPEIDKPPALARRGGVWFRMGAHELHVGVDASFHPAGKAHPGIRVTDVAGLRTIAARLEDGGVRVIWADPGEIAGVERFHCHDPFGNRIELLAPAS